MKHYHAVFKVDIEFTITDRLLYTKKKDKEKGYHAEGESGGMIKFKAVAIHDLNDKFLRLEKVVDVFDKHWITENSLDIIPDYEVGLLTIRGLHYKLVSRGMLNHTRLYKRVISAMVDARRDGQIPYETFSDHERAMIGKTVIEETDVDSEISSSKMYIKHWMKSYKKHKWENQEYYVEVFIEKKTLQGIFEQPCSRNGVALGACKGYPSLTFLNDTADRYKDAEAAGKKLVMLYFGDYDPSGEDIPRSIQANLLKDFDVDVELDNVSLNEEQVLQWDLPPAPIKSGDTRSANWDGLGQVELDAVEPEDLRELCNEAIDKYFNHDLYNELMETQKTEGKKYKKEMKEFVIKLADELE